MRVLLVGDGAREHVLAEQLARSSELYVAMQRRNPGIAQTAQKYMVCDYSNMEAIGAWAIREKIELALVTSETALSRGISDTLAEIGIALASPPGAGAMIGENNVYAFNLMKEKGIARPKFFVCRNEAEIKKAMRELPRVVMKPALRVEWRGTLFGDLDLRKTEFVKEGKKLIKRHGSVILEAVVDGESFSLQAVTDGRSVSIMPPVHITKRALDGEKGELTEGMGGFTSGRLLPCMRESDLETARKSLEGIVSALKSKGVSYRGPIRGEFMATKGGTMMLCAHATFGDMDALNNLPLLRTQLTDTLMSAAQGRLTPMSFAEKATVVKCLVPEGYPGKMKKRTDIKINEKALWNNGAKVYCESVEIRKGKLLPLGGRALAICAAGATVAEAEAKAEAAASSVDGALRHRKDIGTRDYVNRCAKHVGLIRSPV